MRFSLITFVAALAGVAVAQKSGVSQIPDGQVQAPTGKGNMGSATVSAPPTVSKTNAPKTFPGGANGLTAPGAFPLVAALAYLFA
jgi:hypothetical protein